MLQESLDEKYEEDIKNPFMQAYHYFLADMCRLLSIRECIISLE
jgi:hypothetical protein